MFRMFRLVRRLPSREREAAFAAALDAGEGVELDALAAEILDLFSRGRHGRRLAVTLLARWDRLSPDAQRAAGATIRGDVVEVLRTLGDAPDPPERLAGLSVGLAASQGRFGDEGRALAELLPSVHRGLDDQDERVRRRSADVLASLARGLDPEDRAAWIAIDSALAEAAERFDTHRSDELMRAVAEALPNAGPALRDWVAADRAQVGQMALRRGAKQIDLSTSPEMLVRWLGLPTVASEAVRRLEQIDRATDLPALLEVGHLLRVGARSAALRRMRHPERLLPDAGMLASLTGSARAGAFEWAAVLPVAPSRRRELANAFLRDPDVSLRVRAVGVLGALRLDEPTAGALFEFALDADERVASAAADRLGDPGDRGSRAMRASMLSTLTRSPHEAVRRSASLGLSWLGRVDDVRLAKLSPDELLGELGDEIARASGGACLRAMERAEKLGLGASLEQQLIGAVSAGDPACAAKALKLLARVKGTRADRAIAVALGHEDPRVRAEAVEAAAGRASIVLELEALARDETPRVRANAVRAMLAKEDTSAGVDALVAMLRDERSAHRRSALWVAERSGHPAVASMVAEALRGEGDASLRRRAARCARRVLLRPTSIRVAAPAEAGGMW
ncbi:MAG: HEAT repeat domain-containing protein [Planctomycetota bacterium]